MRREGSAFPKQCKRSHLEIAFYPRPDTHPTPCANHASPGAPCVWHSLVIGACCLCFCVKAAQVVCFYFVRDRCLLVGR